MIINSHGGHNKHRTGASGYLDELTEDRKVNKYFIQYMRNLGHTVYDCTDDRGTTVNQILANTVRNHNKHKVDFGVSFHLNASNGQGHGCEVYYYDNRTKAIAGEISKAIAKALNIRDRGPKNGAHLYVVRETKEPLVLVECCFVDNKNDAEQWNPKKCAKAVAEVIAGKKIVDKPVKKPVAERPKPIKPFKVKVTSKALNIRKTPNTNYPPVGKIIGGGVYTITEKKDNWGKLKSGAGWICLDYTKKL